MNHALTRSPLESSKHQHPSIECNPYIVSEDLRNTIIPSVKQHPAILLGLNPKLPDGGFQTQELGEAMRVGALG